MTKKNPYAKHLRERQYAQKVLPTKKEKVDKYHKRMDQKYKKGYILQHKLESER